MQAMRLLRIIPEIIGWLQIAASPLLAGVIIGDIIYFLKRDNIGLALGVMIALLGLVAGIIWATKIGRRKGTVDFMSRLLQTPELGDRVE